MVRFSYLLDKIEFTKELALSILQLSSEQECQSNKHYKCFNDPDIMFFQNNISLSEEDLIGTFDSFTDVIELEREVLVSAHVLLERFIKKSGMMVTKANQQVLISTALMLAIKINHDNCDYMRTFARLCMTTTTVLKKCELIFCDTIDYNLFVIDSIVETLQNEIEVRSRANSLKSW